MAASVGGRVKIAVESHQQRPTVSPGRLPDPHEPVPPIDWAVLGLFLAATLIFAGASALAVAGSIPFWVAVPVNAVAIYMFFTVLHDASHRSASTSPAVNSWLGRISVPMLIPFASYSVFRYVHMQHHRFTNHDDGSDPDHYASAGPAWQLPLRWATIDLVSYLPVYLGTLGSRPRKELVEYALTLLASAAVAVVCISTGNGVAWLLLYLLPGRLALIYLAWAFDWLPHHKLESKPSEDRFRTTRNRVGGEWLWSPIMLYQNYHLVHHLHPLIPFHRYVRAWRRNEEQYLSQDPPLTTIAGRELSAEEYRERRGLDRPERR